MLYYLTQTTLSVDDTRDIIAALQHRFPAISGPRGEDICYATSNRQDAVKAIAGECDRMIVIGAPNSSNSLRLVEVAERLGTPAHLVQRGSDIRSEEHTSELQSLMRISYAVFCLKKKKINNKNAIHIYIHIRNSKT